MKKIIVVTIAMLLGGSAFLNAGSKYDKKYFEISPDNIRIIELGENENLDINVVKGVQDNYNLKSSTGILPKPGLPPVPEPSTLPEPPAPPEPETLPEPNTPPSNDNSGPSFQDTLDNINGTVDTLDRIVNLAQKIFNIIKENQPVVNINVNYANAIPYGIQHWTQLQGWSKPAVKRYAFVAKNGYGMNVVKVVYQVHYTYGGNYKGIGKYLTGVTVEPISVETAWGYNVDLTAEVPDSTIANVGTSENPIASMQVQLKWKIHTIIKDIQQKSIYYIQGDGLIEEIGTPFQKSSADNKTLKQVKSF